MLVFIYIYYFLMYDVDNDTGMLSNPSLKKSPPYQIALQCCMHRTSQLKLIPKYKLRTFPYT